MNNEFTLDVIVPAYNEEATILNCVESIKRQKLDDRLSVSMIVVDDCSDDATGSKLAGYKGFVSVFRNASRSGRAKSINNGVSYSSAEFVMVMDADCVLEREDFISAHVKAVMSGAFMSVSPIKALGKDFWARYQENVNSRREKLFLKEGGKALTTACFCISRNDFISLGGFSEKYREYGFEDKDFLLRVEENNDPKVVLLKKFPAVHSASLSVRAISEKMKKSGMHSSLVFSEKYPDYYKKIAFYKFDTRVSRTARIVSVCVNDKMLSVSVGVLDNLTKSKVAPFFIISFFVKIISALYFMKGTRVTMARIGEHQ